jgi:hypothetical protein
MLTTKHARWQLSDARNLLTIVMMGGTAAGSIPGTLTLPRAVSLLALSLLVQSPHRPVEGFKRNWTSHTLVDPSGRRPVC